MLQYPVPEQILTERRGTVAGSRNLMYERSVGDILVFIDTDQEAPPGWLWKLIQPLVEGEAHYVCGPTRPICTTSKYADYLAIIEHRHYYMCRYDQTIFPMGNSAWSRDIFETLIENDGYLFDERFDTGGEDYDINLRATALGYEGKFIPSAWVWHDQSELNTALKIIKKKIRYCKGGSLAYMKNKALAKRLKRRVEMKPYVHWLEGFQKMAQVVGFLMAVIERRKSAWEI
jgi:GT2 family glycosyltransferase